MRDSTDALDAPPRLICPGCQERGPAGELFCDSCRLPLVIDGGREPSSDRDSARRRLAQKIKPQLSEGRLVPVGYAGNLAEAEFIQGLLLEEGVPSLLRRSAGFDVPDFLAAGPRDVLVPESGAPVARQTLLDAELVQPNQVRAAVSAPKLLAGLLAALAVGVLVVWLLLQASADGFILRSRGAPDASARCPQCAPVSVRGTP
jgi:hypothetical protein